MTLSTIYFIISVSLFAVALLLSAGYYLHTGRTNCHAMVSITVSQSGHCSLPLVVLQSSPQSSLCSGGHNYLQTV